MSPCPSANTAACPAASHTVAVAVASSASKLTGVDKNSRLAPPRAASPRGREPRRGRSLPRTRDGGRVADLRLDLAASAGKHAQQRAGGMCAQVVTALVGADREGVGEYRGAVRRW